MIDIFAVEETKVSTNLWEYSTIFEGETGEGKTDSLNRYLKSVIPSDKKVLWIFLEDRHKGIPGLTGVEVHTVPELLQVVAQLRNPKAKETYACIAFDTFDKLGEMLDKYVTDSKEIEILQDLQFGKGNKYLNAQARVLTEIRNLGFPIHGTVQVYKNEDIIKHTVSYNSNLQKDIKNRIFADAFFIGAVNKDSKAKEPEKSDRLITFSKSQMYPDLKLGMGTLPKVMHVAELKDNLTKMFEENYDASQLSTQSVYEERKVEDNFDDVIKEGQEYGNKLVADGHTDEAMNILKTDFGMDGERVKNFGDLVPAQLDLAKVVTMKLKDLCVKYNLI